MSPKDEKEKRKHARVSHSGTVEFVTDERRFEGRSVNVSRSGMQVEVRLPDSFESVRRVTFTLPTSDSAISVPFRFVRAAPGTRSDVVGLEFDFDDETQRLLIEQFIRDVKQRADDEAVAEMRRVPRTSCSLTEVTCTRADITIVSIDNVSTEGLLLTFDGPLAPGDDLELRAVLPDDGRSLKLSGRVVYVIGAGVDGSSVAGVRLHPSSEVFEARLRNFISERRSTDALRDVYAGFADTQNGSSEYRIDDFGEIHSLLSEAARRNATINTLSEQTLKLIEHKIATAEVADAADASDATVTPGGGAVPAAPDAWVVLRPDVAQVGTGTDPVAAHADTRTNPADAPPDTLYVAFALEGGSYVFRTTGVAGDDGFLWLRLPTVMYRSEKRASERQDSAGDRRVRLRPRRSPGGSGSAGVAGGFREGPGAAVEGRLLDFSRHGFLCEVVLDEAAAAVYVPGLTVSYEIDPRLGLSDHGQVRHSTVIAAVGQERRVQLGIEAGIARGSYAYRCIVPAEWNVEPRPVEAVPVSLESLSVRYRNDRDQEIAALLNATRFHVEAPVLIIPPAFGKKKETLAPFVATLLTNFARAGQDVVTLRYDGINRPGESFNEVEDPPRGYEMLRYRLSQGLSDLRTTLDYVDHNPHFTATKVVLFTASMSSIDARKLLASTEKGRVDLWVSLMGVPAAQTTIGNILAGTDIIGNYRLGIANGVRGMLGHLIDMDTLAEDLIEERYAYLTDARVDMSTVSTPVLWIVGRHDHWVDRDEVADLMAVDGGGPRELVEIPTGHNLRNSEDAIRAFKLIGEYIYRGLYGSDLTAVDPPKEAVLEMLATERERMNTSRPPAIEEYWRDYLLGAAAGSEGYDFYRNLADFRRFLDLEAKLIGVRDGDRVADLGCGTGLLTEALLEHIAAASGTADAGGAASADGPASPPNISITAVDLVADALERTREKCDRLIAERPELLRCSIEYRDLDLEPNRLLPITRLVETGGESVVELRGRVEGLSSAAVEALEAHDGETLSAALAGEPIGAEDHEELARTLPAGVLPVVLDLNRAARFVCGRIESNDVSPGRRGSGRLRSGDLLFDVLHFGDWAVGENTGFPDESFDRILASLFLSYLINPDYALAEFYRMLAPGGRLLVSTMRPDSDVSTIFTDYVEEVRSQAESGGDLASAQAMLNEAAALFELEEDGLFRFYTGDELAAMLEETGFTNITLHRSLGTPPQAIIVTGERPER
jgi:ubiquinone/menaquinone biosynthesis C-methylase UbiE